MNEFLEKFIELQKRKIKDEERRGIDFDSTLILGWIKGEVEEVAQELKLGNSVYLEDELGDIFWTYLRLLYSLEREGHIDLENVFKRCEKKYEQRVQAVENDISWSEMKKAQKEKLQQEYEEKYGK